MKSKNISTLVLTLFATFAASPAFAHSVWIEPTTNGQLIIRFAEPDGRLEKSPRHLDSLSSPVAFTVITNTAVAVEASKSTNHFLLVTASPTNTACAETSFIVMSAPGKPGRKPNFYARWSPSLAVAATPALNLDLVPTGRLGEVRIYFRGKPLGGAKATLRTPDEVERELTADAEGFLRFESKQSGQHHLSIGRHRETLAGFHVGKAYGLTSHNAALT